MMDSGFKEKKKTSENVETCLMILPGTFIWLNNVSSSSSSSSGIFRQCAASIYRNISGLVS
jgi:hypothetical protein